MTNDTIGYRELTPEEQEEFERRRESAVVIQYKCTSCNAWYETAKRSVAFSEVVQCDCGNTLSFTVPALDGVRELSNQEVIELHDPAAKLDTGMSVKEALGRAASWWDRKGRFLILDQPRMKRFALDNPDDSRFLPSGLLNGHTWDMLGKREKIQIVKVWHHFNVRKPDLIGDPEERFATQDRNNVN